MYDGFEEEEKIEVGREGEEEINIPPPLTLIQKTIKDIHEITGKLYERVMHAHSNFQQIIALSNQWIDVPLYVRDKSTKRITFGSRLDGLKIVRYMEIGTASNKIQKLLKENLLLFKGVPLTDPNRGKLLWTGLIYTYFC